MEFLWNIGGARLRSSFRNLSAPFTTREAFVTAGILAWTIAPYAVLALVSRFASTRDKLLATGINSVMNLLFATIYVPWLLEEGGFFPT